jgi:hypothetical protein
LVRGGTGYIGAAAQRAQRTTKQSSSISMGDGRPFAIGTVIYVPA